MKKIISFIVGIFLINMFIPMNVLSKQHEFVYKEQNDICEAIHVDKVNPNDHYYYNNEPDIYVGDLARQIIMYSVPVTAGVCTIYMACVYRRAMDRIRAEQIQPHMN